jgi:hypothetical protein
MLEAGAKIPLSLSASANLPPRSTKPRLSTVWLALVCIPQATELESLVLALPPAVVALIPVSGVAGSVWAGPYLGDEARLRHVVHGVLLPHLLARAAQRVCTTTPPPVTHQQHRSGTRSRPSLLNSFKV